MYVFDRGRWFIVTKRHSREWTLQPGVQGNLISSSESACVQTNIWYYLKDQIWCTFSHWYWSYYSVYVHCFKSGYSVCFSNEARFFIYASLLKMSVFSLCGTVMILQLLNKRSEYCHFCWFTIMLLNFDLAQWRLAVFVF